MASLYNISEEILRLFDTIEENGGEITDEQYETFCIKQEELKEKLDSYVKAIKEFQSDADFCKKEKQSINDRQNVYKNRIERLKTAVLDAVLRFGETNGKNHFVELPTCRVFTKNTKAVEIDEQRTITFMKIFTGIIQELNYNGMLDGGEDTVDLEGILISINNEYKAECELDNKEFIPFTMEDVLNLKVSIIHTATINELLQDRKVLKMYADDPISNQMKEDTSKEEWKSVLTDHSDTTIAKLVTNVSLQIK